MKYTTTIQDIDGKEWSFEGEVIGRGMYDDNGEKSGFCIEGFNIVDILLTLDRKEHSFSVENIDVMPDDFSERVIRVLKQDARDAFIEEWMNFQECAHDAFISQKLA